MAGCVGRWTMDGWRAKTGPGRNAGLTGGVTKVDAGSAGVGSEMRRLSKVPAGAGGSGAVVLTGGHWIKGRPYSSTKRGAEGGALAS